MTATPDRRLPHDPRSRAMVDPEPDLRVARGSVQLLGRCLDHHPVWVMIADRPRGDSPHLTIRALLGAIAFSALLWLGLIALWVWAL
jgi:hypothetical protein